MAALQQQVHGLAGGGGIVGGDAGEVGEVQPLGGVGEEHRRGGDGGEIRAEAVQVAAQEEEASRLILPSHGGGEGHLVVILVQVVDGGVKAPALHAVLGTLHHVGKEQVAAALDDDGDGAADALLQVPGVGVGGEAVGLHHCHDPLSCGLADVRVVVQDPGDGTHGIAGFPGNVPDGNRHRSYPFTAPAATPLMMCFWQRR